MPKALRPEQPIDPSPLAPRPASHPAPRAADAPPRVLLVEDDPLQARGLLRLLQSLGALCHAVPSAEAALLAIATLPPYDLILSDLQLPGALGSTFAERLRRPLLVCYTGSVDTPPFFDLVLRKPALRELLHLVRAPRLQALLVEIGEGAWQGRLREQGLTCHGRSPAQVLRTLAQALEADAAPPGHA